jgi:hypothetical protein
MALKTMDTLYKRAKEIVRYVKGHQVIAAIYLTKHQVRRIRATHDAAQQHPLGWCCHHV